MNEALKALEEFEDNHPDLQQIVPSRCFMTIELRDLRDLIEAASDGDLDCELWVELKSADAVFDGTPRLVPVSQAYIDSRNKQIILKSVGWR